MALFERAGLNDALASATADVDGRRPELAIQLFLRKIWVEHIDGWSTSTGWIQALVEDANQNPDGSFADAGHALERLLAVGAERGDLSRVARAVAYEVAFGIVNLLDDGSDLDRDEGGYPGWGLYECNGAGASTGRQMAGLHETILSIDPSGREGRPERNH